MLRDHAKVHYLNHHNCAESLLMAANEVYNLGLTDREILMMKGFLMC